MFYNIILNFLFISLLNNRVLSTDKFQLKNSIANLKNAGPIISNTYEYVFEESFKMPAGPIFGKSWLKYYTYNKQESSKLNEFFKNFAFYEQFKGGVVKNLNLADDVMKII